MNAKIKYLAIAFIVIIIIVGGVSYFIISGESHFGFPSTSTIHTDLGNSTRLGQSKIVVSGPTNNISRIETLYYNSTATAKNTTIVTIIEAHANNTNDAKAIYKSIIGNSQITSKNAEILNETYYGFIYTVTNTTAFGYKGQMLFIVVDPGSSASVMEKLAKTTINSMSTIV